jgi:hypothetical protein
MANHPLPLVAHHSIEEFLSLWKKSKIPSETALSELPEAAAKKIGTCPS